MKTTLQNLLTCIISIGIFNICHTQSQEFGGDLRPYGDEAFEVLVEMFAYDEHAPLDVSIVEKQDLGNYFREKIVFSGNFNSRVPGYVALPKNQKGPLPVMILLHAGSSTKDNWWGTVDSQVFQFERGKSLIDSLTNNGYSVIALDAEFHGERLKDNDFVTTVSMYFNQGYFQKFKELQINSIIEYRRLIDYISHREDLDENRIGIMGMSMGGVMSTIIMSLEDQIKVAVLCSTPLTQDKNSPILFPFHYAPRIKNEPPILYIYGNNDRMISQKSAEYFFTLLNTSQKEIVQLESGHQPSMEYVPLSIGWIKKFLK